MPNGIHPQRIRILLQVRLLSVLDQGDGVTRTKRAFCNNPGAKAAAPPKRRRHPGFSDALDITAHRARPTVLKQRFSHPKAPVAQPLRVDAARHYVAPVLAVIDLHAGFTLDSLEVLGGDEGHLAHPPEAAPVSGSFAVAVPLETASFDGQNVHRFLHRCPFPRGGVDAFYRACHTTTPLPERSAEHDGEVS